MREALVEEKGFRSAQEVYAALRSAGNSIGLSTVYRHLQAFADQGLVDVIYTSDGETTYRFCGGSTRNSHHHHLVCRGCGRTEEIEGRGIERWATNVAAKYGFTDVEHTVEVFGLCAACNPAA